MNAAAPPRERHARGAARLAARMRRVAPGERPALGKRTSNLFRARAGGGARLEIGGLDEVLAIDPRAGWVEAGGMTTYARLVEALLPHGFMPAVVPQLKSITLGGAVSGLGIEATSFRHGLVHETMLELEVLTPDGGVLRCTPENGHRELFLGMANSYGTLGYILSARARILPVKPFVRVEHRRYSDADGFFAAVREACASDADFVDGVIFGPGELVLSRASFTDSAPAVSDYTRERIYYRSLREREVDHLTAAGYLWRWDTDWFWGSRHFGAERPWVRRLAGRRFLNSVTYTKLMRIEDRWGLLRRFNRLRGRHGESIVQDILIPVDRGGEFLAFLLREIGILPIWICPVRAPASGAGFPLVPLAPGRLGVDFGFWDTKWTPEAHPPGHFNRLIERETARLEGFKSLYSEAFYSEAEFWARYGKAAYDRLKSRYDPGGRLRDLYEKCVLAK